MPSVISAEFLSDIQSLITRYTTNVSERLIITNQSTSPTLFYTLYIDSTHIQLAEKNKSGIIRTILSIETGEMSVNKQHATSYQVDTFKRQFHKILQDLQHKKATCFVLKKRPETAN